MQDQSHIVSAFDRDLEDIHALIMKMGGMVEAAIHDSTEALLTRDCDRAQAIRAEDNAIDDIEEQINQEAARIIALRAPMGTDLRTVLAVIKVASALERVGDYAKNMAKRTSVLAEMNPISGTDQAIKRMCNEVALMLKDVLDAYIRRDADMAQSVRLRDHDVDQMYNALFREVLTHMMEDPRKITACMHLHFIAKNIERMGDHVTNIAEQVIYQITGELPDEERSKGDVTSTGGTLTGGTS